MSGMDLLVTRPLPGGRKTADGLKALGHRPLLCPLFTGKTLPFDIPLPHHMVAFVFTSARAAEAVFAAGPDTGHKSLPCFVVGDTTAGVAEKCGFDNVINARGGVQDLVALIEKQDLRGTVFYPCAINRKPDLEEAFRHTGLVIDATPVYEMVVNPKLPQHAIDRLRGKGMDAILIYSQRSARQFVVMCDQFGIDVAEQRFLCLSRNIRQTLEISGARTALVASEPNETALFAQIGALTESISTATDPGWSRGGL